LKGIVKVLIGVTLITVVKGGLYNTEPYDIKYLRRVLEPRNSKTAWNELARIQESAKKMIDAAPANVSNRMRKNQTADRHCSIKYVVARLQRAFGPARSVSPAGRNTKKINAG